INRLSTIINEKLQNPIIIPNRTYSFFIDDKQIY
ncbi:unnamed protein product, partial [marine sediment metagenome]